MNTNMTESIKEYKDFFSKFASQEELLKDFQFLEIKDDYKAKLTGNSDAETK